MKTVYWTKHTNPHIMPSLDDVYKIIRGLTDKAEAVTSHQLSTVYFDDENVRLWVNALNNLSGLGRVHYRVKDYFQLTPVNRHTLNIRLIVVRLAPPVTV